MNSEKRNVFLYPYDEGRTLILTEDKLIGVFQTGVDLGTKVTEEEIKLVLLELLKVGLIDKVLEEYLVKKLTQKTNIPVRERGIRRIHIQEYGNKILILQRETIIGVLQGGELDFFGNLSKETQEKAIERLKKNGYEKGKDF